MASSWTKAPSLVALLEEVKDRWPNRSTALDGFIGDAAHFDGIKAGQRAGGEHIPTDAKGIYRKNGVVRALDIDVRGASSQTLLDLLLADARDNDRIAYVIHKAVIYSRVRGFAPKSNSGHQTHIHVSLRNNASSRATVDEVDAAAADTSAWLTGPAPFKVGEWLEVATTAGLRARYGPGLDGKIRTTVAQGYRVKVYEQRHVDGMWWARGSVYWYASDYLKRSA